MTTHRKNPLLGFIGAQVALLFMMFMAMPAFAGNYGGGTKGAKNDLVDVAVEAGSFNTLAAALKAAGLVDTLKGDGPFTVFAPTDATFANLPEGTLEMLLKPENKAKLTAILTYHVVPGRVEAAQVVTLDSADTVNGKALTVTTDDNGVRVNQANVIKTDIPAINGIIHVIDEVILPPAS